MGIDKILQDALLKRALGYDYEESRMVGGKNGGAGKVEISRKHMPADLATIKYIQLLMVTGEWEKDC